MCSLYVHTVRVERGSLFNLSHSARILRLRLLHKQMELYINTKPRGQYIYIYIYIP